MACNFLLTMPATLRILLQTWASMSVLVAALFSAQFLFDSCLNNSVLALRTRVLSGVAQDGTRCCGPCHYGQCQE